MLEDSNLLEGAKSQCSSTQIKYMLIDKLKLSRAQNPRRVAWHLLHVQVGNDNYIDLSAHMHASQAQVEGCRTSLEVE